MKTFSTLHPLSGHHIALTIGMFDGVHVGHQTILQRVKEAEKLSVCLTFSNHPASVLSPQHPIPLLSTPRQKERLIAALGIHVLFMIPFTTEFANQKAEAFLRDLHQLIPFTRLILGYDAHIGNQRAGTPEVVRTVGSRVGFEVEYLEPVLIDGSPVSSRRIREALTVGEIQQAQRLLGRLVSFYARVHKGSGYGKKIGYPTANLDIQGICRPPFGVYAVTVRLKDRVVAGVANLGVAPTLQQNRVPTLEVHLFDVSLDLYEQEVEVVLHHFLRPERRFEHAEALKTQINHDIQEAKRLLSH